MSGLRGRQKEMRRQAIMDAALALFEKQGFQATTVEQIAADAAVSAPTVFNYFGTKQQIIIDLLRSADEVTFLESCALAEEVEDPLEALCTIEIQGTRHTLQVLPIAVWREILPQIMIPGSPLYDAYQEQVQAFMRGAAGVLRRLAERGLLRRELDAEACIQIIMDLSHMRLIRLVAQPEPDLEAHRRDVRRIISALLYGMQGKP